MPKDNLPSVAIFGASGAIGTALCHSYQQNGWHVTAVGRDKKPKNKLLMRNKLRNMLTTIGNVLIIIAS